MPTVTDPEEEIPPDVLCFHDWTYPRINQWYCTKCKGIRTLNVDTRR